MVGTSGNTNYIKTASIVAGINAQSGSYVAISADKVDLTGYVTASDITAAFLKAIIAEIDILDANGIFGTSLNIGNSGGITQYGVGWFDGGISLYGSSTFTNCLISASVSGDTLTLTPANGNAITFSKAVTLSGAWGGTTAAGKYYTVTASMNNVDVASRSSGSVKADIVPSYNSSTHKYDISYYAYTGDTFLYNNSDETGTEAYDAGYKAGWNDCIDAAVVYTLQRAWYGRLYDSHGNEQGAGSWYLIDGQYGTIYPTTLPSKKT